MSGTHFLLNIFKYIIFILHLLSLYSHLPSQKSANFHVTIVPLSGVLIIKFLNTQIVLCTYTHNNVCDDLRKACLGPGSVECGSTGTTHLRSFLNKINRSKLTCEVLVSGSDLDSSWSWCEHNLLISPIPTWKPWSMHDGTFYICVYRWCSKTYTIHLWIIRYWVLVV